MVLWRHIIWLFLSFGAYDASESGCSWSTFHCDRTEVLCKDRISVLLNAKNPLDQDHCLAINDEDNEKFRSYEVEVELLSLESNEGQNSGYLGIVFNYLDQKNYDFIYLGLHNSDVPNPPAQRSPTTFTSGYRLDGDFFVDEPISINKSIEGNIFHKLRIVIDKKSAQSTKVFLDGNLIGAFQEHFVPRLKGGVFVVNEFESVGLFRNFNLKGCAEYTEDGNCIDYPGWQGTFQQTYTNGHKDTTTITCSGSMVWRGSQLTQEKLLKVNDEGVPRPDSRYQGWFYRPWNRATAWEYFRFLSDGRFEVHHFCTDGCKAISPEGSSNFCCSSISEKGSRCP